MSVKLGLKSKLKLTCEFHFVFCQPQVKYYCIHILNKESQQTPECFRHSIEDRSTSQNHLERS